MSYLHEKGICHGDLYAHNVLVDGETGAAVLCDFGASFFYPSDLGDSFMLEGTEVRAFGLMARDMACRSAGCEWILQVGMERDCHVGCGGYGGLSVSLLVCVVSCCPLQSGLVGAGFVWCLNVHRASVSELFRGLRVEFVH